MRVQSLLIIESTPGAGSSLSRALLRRYPTWSVATADSEVAVSVLRDGGLDAVVAVGSVGGGESLEKWIQGCRPSATSAVFEIGASESSSDGADELAQRIGRSVMLRERFSGPDLDGFVASLKRIPVISSVYQDVCQALAFNLVAEHDYRLSEVADLIGQDPGMAAQVMEFASFSNGATAEPVRSIPLAVALLGPHRVSSLLLGVSLSDQIVTSGLAGHVVEKDWHDAMLTAQLSRQIAAHEGLANGELDAVYAAGLLHNLGRFLLAANLPQHFAAIDWPDGAPARLAIEREEFGAGHTELGARLLGRWGLDDEIQEAVAFYADPCEGGSRDFGLLAAVHGAVVLLGRGHLEWDKEFLLEAGLADRIEKWPQLVDIPRTAVATQ